MRLATLSEAMEHETPLETNDFWIDLHLAVAAGAGLPPPAETTAAAEPPPPSPEESPPEFEQPAYASTSSTATAEGEAELPPLQRALQSAATRLLSPRATLYPVTIHLLDLWLIYDH